MERTMLLGIRLAEGCILAIMGESQADHKGVVDICSVAVRFISAAEVSTDTVNQNCIKGDIRWVCHAYS